MPVLIPDLVYRNRRFEPGVAVEYDAASGLITRVGPAAAAAAGTRHFRGVADAAGGAREVDPDIVRLPGAALLPGFVNAHSHAFQRVIRGRTQWRPADDSISDFWSWRVAMYDAALRLTPDDVYDVSRFCFVEMLRAGITTVGEFHYLHNDPAGRWYDDVAELAHRVIAAARAAGIRIRLLNVCYAAGGIGEPLRTEQRRFATPDLDAFVGATSVLAARYVHDPLVSVGIAPHSVRAVPRDWLRPLHEHASAHDMPLHMHAAEQPAEVEACVAAFGVRPVELLHEDGLLDERFTAVHATHITSGEVALLGHAGATVCACPSTERDLGDGILRAADLVRAGASIALGSDSQTVLDMLEEMRLVEYHERLRRLERVVVTAAADGDAPRRLEPAPLLLEMATMAGARSLRLPVGVIEQGHAADVLALDLEHPALAGWTPDTLDALLTFSAPADVVRDVWVGGRHVIDGRTHAAQEVTMQAFRTVSHRLVERA
jgi:formimidoylglutamate deiminase